MYADRLEQMNDPEPATEEQNSPSILSILCDPELLHKGIASRREYENGETVLVEGSIGRSLFLIEYGRLRVLEHVELEDRRRIQPGLCDLGAGEIFGELSLLEPAPRSATVMAIESCRLLEFDTGALSDFLDRNPEKGYLVLKDLFSVLTGRLRQADKRLGQLFAWGLKAHGIDRHL